jgi:hypothetical protein
MKTPRFFIVAAIIGIVMVCCGGLGFTATAALEPTETATPTNTAVPTQTATVTNTLTNTATATFTATDTATITNTPTITDTPTITNTPTITPIPSQTPRPTLSNAQKTAIVAAIIQQTMAAQPTNTPIVVNPGIGGDAGGTGGTSGGNSGGSGIRIGAICNDGTHSSATGSGACSHHGGVARWLYASP